MVLRKKQCLVLLFKLHGSSQDFLSSVVNWLLELHVYFTVKDFKSTRTHGNWNMTSISPYDGYVRVLFYSIISISVKRETVLL